MAPEEPLVLASIVAGGAHTCALDADGRAWCWGSNSHGQLGISDDRPLSAAPLAVNGAIRFRQLAAGARHTCGIATDDRAWCWGANESGQLGDGTHRRRHEPRVVPLRLRFAHLAGGAVHTCGVALDGHMWCWGRNDSGQLGTTAVDAGGSPLPLPGAGDLRFSRVAAGAEHTCAITLDATALCWGSNRAGELGAATQEPSIVPVRVAGGAIYRQLAAGASFTCGVSVSDRVLCWGRNVSGELGVPGWERGTGTPVMMPDTTSLEAVAASSDGSFVCAASASTVSCWGGRREGGTSYRTRPHFVEGLPAGVVESLAAGREHACAIVDGAAWCWGEGQSGQLGDGATRPASAAVAVTS